MFSRNHLKHWKACTHKHTGGCAPLEMLCSSGRLLWAESQWPGKRLLPYVTRYGTGGQLALRVIFSYALNVLEMLYRYDKRNDFKFKIISSPNLSGNIPINPDMPKG